MNCTEKWLRTHSHQPQQHRFTTAHWSLIKESCTKPKDFSSSSLNIFWLCAPRRQNTEMERRGCHGYGAIAMTGEDSRNVTSSFCWWEEWEKLLTEEQTSATTSGFLISRSWKSNRRLREDLLVCAGESRYINLRLLIHTNTHTCSEQWVKNASFEFYCSTHTFSLVHPAFAYRATFPFKSHCEVDSVHSAHTEIQYTHLHYWKLNTHSHRHNYTQIHEGTNTHNHTRRALF